jgi:fucose 4-O-acetylase-like acetyltransferase
MHPGGAPAPGRQAAIDFVKAAAIVAVVFTHARFAFLPGTDRWDFWLCASWTYFQVPAFLFASGYLACTGEPLGAGWVGRRFARVLVPYLVASGVAYAVGVAHAPDLGALAFQLATGSALGVYYYVLLILLISPLAHPLSRAPRSAVALGLAGCAALALAPAFGVQAIPRADWFWSLRNPLDHFSLGFFLAGWLARLEAPRIARAWQRARAPLSVAIAAGLAMGVASVAGRFPASLEVPLRVAYTFAVLGLIAATTRGRTAGATVRFLGDASLALYLYHRIFQRLLEPRVAAWPEPAGTLALVAAGLGGASLVALAGRRALGRARARRWLGA